MVQFFVAPGVSSSRFNIAFSNTAGNVGVRDSLNEWLTGISIKAGSITKLTRNVDLLLTYQSHNITILPGFKWNLYPKIR